MPDEFTDEALLRRARRGDEGAFLSLYERHHGAAYRFARRLLCDEAAAEDAVHDCFLELVGRPGFDPARGTLRNYLYGMVRHRALRIFRRAGRECELDEAVEEQTASRECGPLVRLLDEELSEAVRRAIANLPPLQREALVLYEYEELSLAEIAEVVGADAGAVKARLWRARANLKGALSDYLSPRGEEALVLKD